MFLIYIGVALVGIGMIACGLWELAVQPAFWILSAIIALIYFWGWWAGVPAIIASLVIVSMWES